MPNSPPLIGVQAVLKQWNKDLELQSDVKLSCKILMENNGVAIASWEASRLINQRPEHSRGVFYIAYDERDLLKEFRQWWV